MVVLHFSLLLLQLMQRFLTIKAEDCLTPADSQGRDIPFVSGDFPSLPNGTQAIVTSYKFHCHESITAWHAYLHPKHTDAHYNIVFQVWRPSPAVDIDGCYKLVGENVLPSVLAADDGLVSETPAPDKIITVSPGDVVGYYFYSTDAHADNGILLDTNYTEETVWYHVNTEEDPLITNGHQKSCLLAIGPSRALKSLTHAAPVLSLNMIIPLQTPLVSPSLTHSSPPEATSVIILPSPTLVPPKGLRPIAFNTIIISAAIVFLIILCLIFFTLTLIVAVKRKKRMRKSPVCNENDANSHMYDNADSPIYESLQEGESLESESDIEMTPNESYAMILSYNTSYGASTIYAEVY